MRAGFLGAVLCCGISGVSGAQAVHAVPGGTPLTLRSDAGAKMRVGAAVTAELVYPIYVDNELVVPAGTRVTGSVVALRPDHGRRVRAELGGDFTPFRIPVVRFAKLDLGNGRTLDLPAGDATDGAQIYRAVAPAPVKGGFAGREIHSGLTVLREDLAAFIGPGKMERLKNFVYSQIPYHPQEIAAGTEWTVETSAAVDVPAVPEPVAAVSTPARKPRFWEVQKEAPAPPLNGAKSTWMIEAYLEEPLSSDTTKQGEEIMAVVAQPVYAADGSVAVPQGATLVGTVTRAKPSRKFGRTGVLSFNFRQLVFPKTQQTQTVETRLTGADSAADIALNSEGQAKAKPQDKLAIPLLLAVMASRPLDQDAGKNRPAIDQTGKNGVGGAAGLGLVGTIVGLAGGSPYAAATIGYWGTARAVWSRWIAHGQTITFAKDTRIEVETTPRRGEAIKPAAAALPSR